MNVIFSGRAEDQIRDIQAALREINEELATQFALEVRGAVHRLEHFPRSGRKFAEARRIVLRRFRYVMLYEIWEGCVYVTKLAHQRQKRDY